MRRARSRPLARAAPRLVQVVDRAALAGARRAVRAAVVELATLDAVADDAGAAVVADRREQLDRTLEAVEDVRFAAHDHLERLLVVVAADLAGLAVALGRVHLVLLLGRGD